MPDSPIQNRLLKLPMSAGMTALLSVTGPVVWAAEAGETREAQPLASAVHAVLASQQAAALPDPAAQGGNAAELEEVVVTSRSFFQNDAFGATKLGLAIKDTPQTVTVVTADLIDTAGLNKFSDFYKLDASGGTSHTIDNFPRNYYRGFLQQGDSAIRIDGFRVAGNIDLDFATLDRFEVVKGPTSTLYGQNTIGGTLNAVSKLPQDVFSAEIALEGGQFDYYRIDADVTGPFAGSDAWSYRLIGAYSGGHSFLDFGNDELKVFSSSIAFEPSDATRFNLRASFQETGNVLHFAPVLQLAGTGTGDVLERVLTEGLQVPDVTRSRFFGMPWNNAEIEASIVQFQGEHDFASDWTLRGNAQYNRVKYSSDAFFVAGPFDENGFAYFTSAYSHDDVEPAYSAEVNLFGKVELFGRDHTVFFGVDYSQDDFDGRLGFGTLSQGFENSLFDVFDPDYGAVPRLDLASDSYAYLYDDETEEEQYGATVQLILDPIDRLKVLLGGRYSFDTFVERLRTGSSLQDLEDQSFEKIEDLDFENFTIQVGVTYELTDAVNLYASFGETFEPGTGRVFVAPGDPGIVIDPEEGTSYEIGLKADLSDALSFTGAVFELERTNIAQGDRDNPGFVVPLGTQRSRGVELGFQGRLLPELSVFGSIAYLDAEFSEGEFTGLQPNNAPQFGVSVFGTYELLSGHLKGLGFGLGVVHKSGRRTFDDDFTRDAGVPVTFDFGDFTEVDASVFYQRDRWSYELSATNLLNEKYYSPTFESLDVSNHVNPPQTVTATMRYKL